MKLEIPKIIHQIWSGIYGELPDNFRLYGQSWKRDYPDWEYIQWNHESMNRFVQENYPEYWDIYNHFSYHIQQWDAFRYLVLYKMGGLYRVPAAHCPSRAFSPFQAK